MTDPDVTDPDPTDPDPTGGHTVSEPSTDDRPTGILGVRPAEVTEHCLVVGDPNRVDDVAALMTDVREIGRSREYVTVVGVHAGVEVTVASHGVGAGGAAVCFEALARAGVRRFVRAGTCGGLQHDVVDGDLVVGTAAVRDDGLTDRLLPLAWPAAADPALTLELARLAAASELNSHVGVIHTAANFFPSPLPDMPGWPVFAAAGAKAIEMEYAALLVIASLHGAAAGGIFATDGNLLANAADMADYDPDRDVVRRAKEAMLGIALDALVSDAG